MIKVVVRSFLLALSAWSFVSAAASGGAASSTITPPGGDYTPPVRVSKDSPVASVRPPSEDPEPLEDEVEGVVFYNPADFDNETGRRVLKLFTEDLLKELRTVLKNSFVETKGTLADAFRTEREANAPFGKCLHAINKKLFDEFSTQPLGADGANNSLRILNVALTRASYFEDERKMRFLEASNLIKIDNDPRLEMPVSATVRAGMYTVTTFALEALVCMRLARNFWEINGLAHLGLQPWQPVLVLSSRYGRYFFELLPQKPLVRQIDLDQALFNASKKYSETLYRSYSEAYDLYASLTGATAFYFLSCFSSKKEYWDHAAKVLDLVPVF